MASIRQKIKASAIVAAWAMTMPVATLAAPESVAVYTTTHLPPVRSGEPVNTHYINLPDILMQDLATVPGVRQGMTGGEIMARISEQKGSGYFEKIAKAIQGQVKAWGHGIDYLPAIVIDDQYIVYGVYDVATARRHVARYRLQQGRGGNDHKKGQ